MTSATTLHSTILFLYISNYNYNNLHQIILSAVDNLALITEICLLVTTFRFESDSPFFRLSVPLSQTYLRDAKYSRFPKPLENYCRRSAIPARTGCLVTRGE